MTRWEPDAAGRLRQAAMELFQEHGFDETTVAEIAERAGVTERTFFRHFTDKKEVLFGGSDALRELMVDGVAAAPRSTSPIEAVAAGVEAAAVNMDERRAFSQQRQKIIASNPELQERELIKLASLASSITETLRARHVPDPTASLAAQAGIAVFHIAFQRWLDAKNKKDFPTLCRESLSELKSVTSKANARR